MIYSAIVLSAGFGTRYKGKKQDEILFGKPLWRHAYDTALSVVGKGNIVAVGKEIEGGTTRSGSVMNGLKAIPDNTDRVIILEAARPLITKEQIERILFDEHPSVTYVRPLVNTVIYRNGTFIDRNELYDLLTPQAFDYKLLSQAYDSGRFTDMTDETRVMSIYHDIKPFFVETESSFYKVTYPGDLQVIEAIFKKQYEDKSNE